MFRDDSWCDILTIFTDLGLNVDVDVCLSCAFISDSAFVTYTCLFRNINQKIHV